MMGPMLYAVIPAGGSGTRLWPLSRTAHPKFLHALTGSSATLIEATAARVAPLTAPERTFVVTGTSHAAAVSRQLPMLPPNNILVEPSPRDSCPAIGLAAAIIARRDPTAIMASFAADHIVRDEDRFHQTLRHAVSGAEAGFLMTVGMKPTHPETGFGYVHCGDPVDALPVRRVRQFKEKPTRAAAEEFVASGDYLWNASMFVWRVDVFLAELRRQAPEMHEGLTRIAAVWDSVDRETVLAEIWPNLQKIAVEYAVMEGAAADGKVATVPGDFGWSDVGDFRNIADLLEPDADGNATLLNSNAGAISPILHDVSGTVVVSSTGRLVAALGVKDVVLVDTPDVLLVCGRDRAQGVKEIVNELRARRRTEFL